LRQLLDLALERGGPLTLLLERGLRLVLGTLQGARAPAADDDRGNEQDPREPGGPGAFPLGLELGSSRHGMTTLAGPSPRASSLRAMATLAYTELTARPNQPELWATFLHCTPYQRC